MPPDLDIYVLSKSRDRDTLERFISTHVDKEVEENRGDEERMILPLGTAKDPSERDRWDWEPAVTLSHILDRGLDYPRRAVTVYLKPQDEALDRIILAFTSDNQVVFGLSIDDADEKLENIDLAKRLLYDLAESFNGHLGVIASEEPPPLFEDKIQNIRQNLCLEKDIGLTSACTRSPKKPASADAHVGISMEMNHEN
jgi:hypothetical protein